MVLSLEKYPGDVVIYFDTARLSLTSCSGGPARNNKSKTLAGRCVLCRTTLAVPSWLDQKAEGFPRLSDSKIFNTANCYKPAVRQSGHCTPHFHMKFLRREKESLKADLGNLQKLFGSKLNSQWVSPLVYGYERVMQCTLEIKEGKHPGTDLVILDDKLSPSSRQLWESAIVEKISGKVIINTQVNYGTRGKCHETPLGMGNELMEGISKVKPFQMNRIRRHSSATKHAYLDAQEASSRLKTAGITQDALILVWHCSAYDPTLLRSFLDYGGYSGILPPDCNRIPMIPLFRSNLKGLTVPGQKR